MRLIGTFFSTVAALTLGCATTARAQGDKPVAGLAATYSAAGAKDTTMVPNAWLFVPQGGTPSPFLAPGKFDAVFEGIISIDLRGEYAFQAQLNGALKVEVNGEVVLDVKGTGGNSELGKFIRLNKGSNSLKATFTPADSGDAMVRLNWQEKGKFTMPIPPTQLSHSVTPALKDSHKLHLGRELVAEHHCLACHAGPKDGMPELKMDAPTLEGIGARRQGDWLAKWIADPKSLRTNSHMPALLAPDKAKEDSEAIAAYLVSLSTSKAAAPKAGAADQIELGKKVYEGLHCSACHIQEAPKPGDETRITLKHVAAKFSDESLVAFLKQPNQHYEWIRMPQFKWTNNEPALLSAYLISTSEKSEAKSVSAEAAVIARGKSLVQSVGCINCHSLKEENKFSTKALTDLKAADFDKGCVSEKATGKAPFFAFTGEQREALKAFAGTDRSSLTRHVPAEFAERQIRSQNCTSCHGNYEGFPAITWFGEKLKPDWAAKFIAGEIPTKPRPWIEAQMPAFKARAKYFAEGMAHQHGVTAVLQPDPPAAAAAAEMGHRLIGPIGGFSCSACHSVAGFHAEAFEAPGINFSMVNARLRQEFFVRWLQNPTYVDPTSKMPVYFDDESKSMLGDILGGSALKQIDTFWQFMKAGDKMPPPKTE